MNHFLYSWPLEYFKKNRRRIFYLHSSSKGAIQSAIGFSFCNGMSFVELFFAFCKGAFHLHEASLSIDPKRNECQAVRSDFSDIPFHLALLYEKRSRSHRIISWEGSREGIAGDEGVCELKLVSVNCYEGAS